MADRSHECGAAWVVSTAGDSWYPEHPSDYNFKTAGVVIGCNSLHCTGCGETVRQRPDVTLTENGSETLAALFKLADPLDHPSVRPVLPGSARLYYCRCHSLVARADEQISPPANEQTSDVPWSCGRHPALTLPTSLDGVELSADMDFDALVEKTLVDFDAPSMQGLKTDLRGLWLARLHHILADGQARSRLGQAVLRKLTASDANQRVAALLFYDRCRDAAGADKLAQVARAHRELFGSEADPRSPDSSLLSRLLNTIKMRANVKDPKGRILDTDALAFLREQALAGQGAASILIWMGLYDGAWLVDNAARIAAAAPALVTRLVFSIKEAPPAKVEKALLAIAQLPGIDLQAYRAEIVKRIPEKTSAKILAALPANGAG